MAYYLTSKTGPYKYQLLKVNTWNQIFRVISMIILHCCCHWFFFLLTCESLFQNFEDLLTVLCLLYILLCQSNVLLYSMCSVVGLKHIQLGFFSNRERNRNILSDIFLTICGHKVLYFRKLK